MGYWDKECAAILCQKELPKNYDYNSIYCFECGAKKRDMEDVNYLNFHLRTSVDFKDLEKVNIELFENIKAWLSIKDDGRKKRRANELKDKIKDNGFVILFQSRGYSNSKYFVKTDGSQIIRVSDHYNDWVASCSWKFEGQKIETYKMGIADIKDFKRKILVED